MGLNLAELCFLHSNIEGVFLFGQYLFTALHLTYFLALFLLDKMSFMMKIIVKVPDEGFDRLFYATELY
mgnify:CR=1 FL=1